MRRGLRKRDAAISGGDSGLERVRADNRGRSPLDTREQTEYAIVICDAASHRLAITAMRPGAEPCLAHGMIVAAAFALIAAIGILYTLAAALLAGRWHAPAPPLLADAPAITILKPLHGPEPRLADNLASFARQDYPGSDPDRLRRRRRRRSGARRRSRDRCGDRDRRGAPRQPTARSPTSINMAASRTATLIVLSDSDMSVAPDYLARDRGGDRARPASARSPASMPGAAMTGGWSRLAAAGISWGFLPSVMIGLATGLAKPCMGSTIALRRDTLDAIGGFERFADLLADDHAIGAAVRELGLTVAVPPMIVTPWLRRDEPRRAMVRHELRWQATVRMLDPLGYAGSDRHLSARLGPAGGDRRRRLVAAPRRARRPPRARRADRRARRRPYRAALVAAGTRPVVFRHLSRRLLHAPS